MSKKRSAKLSSALAQADVFEALSQVRDLVPDSGNDAQQVVVYGFATVLEVSSAGLSVLFDRFDDEELVKCRAALETIGATRTLHDFDALFAAFSAMVSAGTDRSDASEQLSAHAAMRSLDREHPTYVDEMEQKLLVFCHTHLEELAAG